MRFKDIVKPFIPQHILRKRAQKLHQEKYDLWVKNGKKLPVPHLIKQNVIKEFRRKFGYEVLIETGTYKGHMIDAQLDNFQKIYSIELSKDLYKAAVQKYKRTPKVKLFHGDSEFKLHEVVAELNENAIFWLDGHYSGGITALGNKQCPIYGELDAIFTTSKEHHVILIDDARCFIGTDDYPTLDELKSYVTSKKPQIKIEIIDDVICMY